MPKIKLFGRSAAAFSAALLLSMLWYTVTAKVMTGFAAEAFPVIGAIIIAALTSALALRKSAPPSRPTGDVSLAQQLRLLRTHTMVNVVDTENLLVEVNDLLLEATGFSRDELIGQPVAKLYANDNVSLTDEIRSKLSNQQGWQGETLLRRRDGSICITQTTVTPLVDSDGKWIGSISARTDITKTIDLIAERDIGLTLHELRDDVWIVDEQTETFKYMNRAAKRRFGWTSKAYADLTLSQMAQDQDCKAVLDACAALKSKKETFEKLEACIFGTKFDVSIKWLHPNTPNGRFLIMLNDITDRMAEERKQADFVSMVSHELRSPLTSIKGAMGLLLSRAAGELSPQAVGLLEIAHRNADRLVLIINDILDMEKISSGRLDFDIKEFDVSEMVHEALRSNAATQQRSGVNIRCIGLDVPHMIQTDSNRIIQVLINLMSNAAKFSKPGATIEVMVERLASGVRVSVRDEGTGIPEKDHHKIFQRFADMANSDRGAKGGTGLGLSICKAIVEGLGGTISFESREGEGTTFMFTLPTKISDNINEPSGPILRSVG